MFLNIAKNPPFPPHPFPFFCSILFPCFVDIDAFFFELFSDFVDYNIFECGPGKYK